MAEKPSALRLLLVSHSFAPADRPLANVGGMQRVATELYAALRAHRGVRLRSVLLRTSWRWTHVKTGPFLLLAFFRIRRLALRGEIDAVLFSSMVTAALALLLRPILAPRGVRMAAIAHGRDVTLPFAPYQWLLPRIFGALDALLPVSRATGDEAIARGLDPAKRHVVPNGVEVSRFGGWGGDEARQAVRAAFPASPLPEAALLLLSVGRQVERKGFAWFVDAVMPLLPADVHYWLAGDGPEAAAIDAAAARHGLEGRVRRLGRVSEAQLEMLYRGADLFVMPNRPVPGDMEGFGVVMLEAGLGGLPTVAAALEGIRDVITEGENGHLVESGDARAFADVLLRYHHDRAALRAASTRAARHTAGTFGWVAVAERYVQVLQAV